MESVQILLATCNGARYLPEQLASLQRQTYQDFTLLVSDDGSTDETPALLQELAAKWPGRVAFAAHAPALGNARDNFFWLMEQSRADYVLFCDQVAPAGAGKSGDAGSLFHRSNASGRGIATHRSVFDANAAAGR